MAPLAAINFSADDLTSKDASEKNPESQRQRATFTN